MQGTYDHLPVTMTVAQVCRELQLGQRAVLASYQLGGAVRDKTHRAVFSSSA